MKFYFTAAIFQKQDLGEIYERIVSFLSLRGQVFEDTTKVDLQTALEKSDKERKEYYKIVLNWISKSDMVVVEASFPSTINIGHEVSLAIEKGKPVVILYKKGRNPSFFLGLQSEKMFWVEYEKDNLEDRLENALVEAQKVQDVRFNFFVAPKHLAYLDWVAKTKKLPRAVFLRNLIEREMKKDKGFRE